MCEDGKKSENIRPGTGERVAGRPSAHRSSLCVQILHMSTTEPQSHTHLQTDPWTLPRKLNHAFHLAQREQCDEKPRKKHWHQGKSHSMSNSDPTYL